MRWAYAVGCAGGAYPVGCAGGAYAVGCAGGAYAVGAPAERTRSGAPAERTRSGAPAERTRSAAHWRPEAHRSVSRRWRDRGRNRRGGLPQLAHADVHAAERAHRGDDEAQRLEHGHALTVLRLPTAPNPPFGYLTAICANLHTRA